MKMTVGGRVFYLKRTGRHLKGRPGEPNGGHYTDRAHAALIKGDERHKNTMSGHFGEFAVSIKVREGRRAATFLKLCMFLHYTAISEHI